jgi:4-hydroxybenzoate polyprenyltransferase
MTTPKRSPWPIALLRCTSCRFTAIYFVPFFGALAERGLGTVLWGAFGCLLWFAHSTGTEAVNRLSDRTEDAINRPERTALCERVGFDRLRAVAVLAWAVVGVLDVGALAARRSVTLAVLLLLGAIAAVGYSYGLRLGRRGYVSLFVLTFPFGGTFLIGWALAHPVLDGPATRDLLLLAGPLLLVGGFSIAMLAGVKDMTDVTGDVAAGYRSVWVEFVRTHRGWAVFAVVTWPYLLLAALAATVAPRYWPMFALAPVVLVLALCITRSRTASEHMAVRELLYLYWLAMECVGLWCYAPRPETAAAALAAAAWWLFATRFLHWSPGLDRAWLTTLGDLVAGRRATVPEPREGLPAAPRGGDGR